MFPFNFEIIFSPVCHRFLLLSSEETYHMITQCDEEVASWIGVGDSFRIKDVARFETVSAHWFLSSLSLASYMYI